MKTRNLFFMALLAAGLAACSQDGKQQSSSPTLTGPSSGDSTSAPADTSATMSGSADTTQQNGETTARE